MFLALEFIKLLHKDGEPIEDVWDVRKIKKVMPSDLAIIYIHWKIQSLETTKKVTNHNGCLKVMKNYEKIYMIVHQK